MAYLGVGPNTVVEAMRCSAEAVEQKLYSVSGGGGVTLTRNPLPHQKLHGFCFLKEKSVMPPSEKAAGTVT